MMGLTIPALHAQTGGVRSMTVYFAEGDRDGFAAVPGTAGQGAEGGYYVDGTLVDSLAPEEETSSSGSGSQGGGSNIGYGS